MRKSKDNSLELLCKRKLTKCTQYVREAIQLQFFWFLSIKTTKTHQNPKYCNIHVPVHDKSQKYIHIDNNNVRIHAPHCLTDLYDYILFFKYIFNHKAKQL